MTQIVNGVPVAVLPLTLEQLQAMSDYLHGRRQVRMNPDETWTALKHMDLCAMVDAELALLKAEAALQNKLLPY